MNDFELTDASLRECLDAIQHSARVLNIYRYVKSLELLLLAEQQKQKAPPVSWQLQQFGQQTITGASQISLLGQVTREGNWS